MNPESVALNEAVGVALRLSIVDRLRLIVRLAATLEQDVRADPEMPDQNGGSGRRPLGTLHGLGKEIWQGQDAQEYVDDLREVAGLPVAPSSGANPGEPTSLLPGRGAFFEPTPS